MPSVEAPLLPSELLAVAYALLVAVAPEVGSVLSNLGYLLAVGFLIQFNLGVAEVDSNSLLAYAVFGCSVLLAWSRRE